MLSIHKLSNSSAAVKYFTANYYVKDNQSDNNSQGIGGRDSGNGFGENTGGGNGVGGDSGGNGNRNNNGLQADGGGIWTGKGAATLGLSGPVTEASFSKVLNGVLPDGGRLGRVVDGEVVHAPGWDLTFSAPKSVSVLYEIGGDERILSAHSEAVSTALSYLESNSVSMRSTVNGITKTIRTDKLVIAQFIHHESRELDPQLHTHSVIANMTFSSEGVARSIDSRNMYRDKMITGLIYRNELANALMKFGYDLNQTHKDGRFEIEGVSKEIIDNFSKRRADIEEKLKTSTVGDAKAAARAALITRSSKKDMSLPDLRNSWREEADEKNVNLSKIIKTSINNTPLINVTLAEKDSVDYAIGYLSESESVFTESKVLSTALRYRVGVLSTDEVVKEMESRVDSGKLIKATLGGQAAFTTKRAIFLERANISIMKSGIGTVKPIATADLIQRGLHNQSLKMDQYGAAVAILSSTDRIMGVQGFAGTGKTYMLEKVNRVAVSQNLTVRGYAPTSTAVEQLESSSGIKSSTVASLLASNKFTIESRNAKNIDASNELWVVDESSFLSNHDAYELLKLSELTNSRLVLLGDVKQFSSIEAGKPFEYLQKHGMPMVTMDDIIRQKNVNSLKAVQLSITGDIKQSLEFIGNNVVEIADRSDRLKSIADKYMALSTEDRKNSLVATPLNRDKKIITDHIREALIKDKTLSQKSTDAQVYSKVSLKRVEKADIRNFSQGQILQFNKEYKTIGVKKGEYVEVVSVNKNGALTVSNEGGKAQMTFRPDKIATSKRGGFEVFNKEKRELNIGESIRWTANNKEHNVKNTESADVIDITKKEFTVKHNGREVKVDFESELGKRWDYGYVSTLHAAQGKTSESVVLHGDDYYKMIATQKSYYTGISRAKNDIHIFVGEKESFIKTVTNQLGEKTSALERINMRDVSPKEQIKHDIYASLSPNVKLAPDHVNYASSGNQKAKINEKAISKSRSR